MNTKLIALNELPIGTSGKVKQFNLDGPIKRRFFDLGLIYDTLVMPLLKSPAGDPIAYQIRGTVIALRIKDASKVIVEIMFQ